jgi:hypothetical protein
VRYAGSCGWFPSYYSIIYIDLADKKCDDDDDDDDDDNKPDSRNIPYNSGKIRRDSDDDDYDDDDDDDDEDEDVDRPVCPTWAVGTLFKKARCIDITVCRVY